MKQLADKEIVIVAGPSASGKSHLIQQLMTKKTNTFRDTIYRALNIDPQKPRSCIAIGALAKLKKKPKHSNKLKKEIIFIHFDTTSRRQNKKRKILLSIAKNCKNIKALTLHTDFETWRSRMKERVESNSEKIPLNNALEIYNMSKYIPFFAKRRYDLIYQNWDLLIKDINLDAQLLLKNDEIPFKSKKWDLQ